MQASLRVYVYAVYIKTLPRVDQEMLDGEKEEALEIVLQTYVGSWSVLGNFRGQSRCDF